MAQKSGNQQQVFRKDTRTLFSYAQKNPLMAIIAVTLCIVVVIFVVFSLTRTPQRSASYHDISGAAGLNATISYDCKEACEQKYNFNVYIFDSHGQQMSVVQPNSDGSVRAAFPEGEYIMLIGKRFSDDNIFPQESLELKNGKELELKLHYKEG